MHNLNETPYEEPDIEDVKVQEVKKDETIVVQEEKKEETVVVQEENKEETSINFGVCSTTIAKATESLNLIECPDITIVDRSICQYHAAKKLSKYE